MTRPRRVIVAFALIASLLVVSATPAAASHGGPVVVSSHTTDSDFNSATLTNMSVAGSGASATVETGLADINDGFESGSLSSNWKGGTSHFAVGSAHTQSGSFALEGGVGSSSQFNTIYHDQTSGTESVAVWVFDDSANTGNAAPGAVINRPSGSNSGYQANIHFGPDRLRLDELSSGSATQLAENTSVTLSKDKWYYIKLWSFSNNNTIRAKLYDSDGTTLLATVEATDSTYTGGYAGVSGFGTQEGWYDNFDATSEIAELPAEYQHNHSATNTVEGFANVSNADNVTFTATWRGDSNGDGTYDTLLNQTSGITTATNHSFTWSEFSGDDVQLNITVESAGSNESFVLESEGVLANTAAPTVDNNSASPRGDLETASPTLSIDINDSDFPTGQGDTVTAKFYVDGSFEGSDTLTSNGTAQLTVSSLDGGSHTWHVHAVDSYGHNQTSQVFNIETPGNITIRNVTEPHDIISSATVDVILAGDNETVDRQTVTDGNVSFEGLPTDETYILVIDADNYHRRTVIVEDIFSQSDVYLLNTSFSSVENTFNIDDQTGQFEGDETEIIIQKPLNRSIYDSSFAAEYQWVDIAGDRIGADGSYTVDLEEGDRYRIIVDNNDGDRRVLGEYQAESGGLITLRIGELTFDIGPDGETYEYSASFSDTAVKFNYTDPDSTTSSLTVKIFEVDNASNVIYNQTHSDLGTLSVSQPISGAQVNTTWVVEFSGTRDGEAIDGRVVVGQSNLSPGVPLSDAWKNRIAFSILLLITGLTAGGFNAETGSIAAALTGGILWWTGWLPAEIGGGVVALAIFVAAAMILSTRGGEEIQ